MKANWIVVLAADIAQRVKEMHADGVVNNAELLESLIGAAAAEGMSELIAQRNQVASMDNLVHAATVLVQNGDRMGCVNREDFKILRAVLVKLGQIPNEECRVANPAHRLGFTDNHG